MASAVLRAVAAVALCSTVRGYAGPPLVIEDPGIAEPGTWEIITATTLSSADSGDFAQAPLLDLTLGLAPDLQLGAVIPWVHADPQDGGSESDFGNAQFGVNWRLWNRQGLQVTLAPLYTFGVSRSSAEQGIGSESDVAAYQLVAEIALGERWRLNGAASYLAVDGDSDAVNYGAALGYRLGPQLELMGELAGAADTGLDDDSLDLRLGLDFTLSEQLHLLFSAGTGLREPSGADGLDYDIYLGLQYFP